MIKNKNIMKVIAVLAVMIMTSVILTGCELKKKNSDSEKATTEAYEEPVKNFVEGLSEANSEKFLKAFPSFIADYAKDIFTDEYLEKTLDNAKETYGDNITMTYNIKGKTELSEEDLKSMVDATKTSFDKDITITKGYELDLEIHTKGDKDEDTEDETIDVYEVDGKWCLLNF